MTLIYDDPTKIKHLLRKNILLLISLPEYTDHIRFYLPLPISITVCIFTDSAIIFLTLTPNIPNLFTAIPQHVITLNNYTGYTTHLEKPFPIASGEMCWNAVMIHSDEIIHLYFVIYKLENMKSHSFFHR
jgi:hypothetical protein